MLTSRSGTASFQGAWQPALLIRVRFGCLAITRPGWRILEAAGVEPAPVGLVALVPYRQALARMHRRSALPCREDVGLAPSVYSTVKDSG